MAEPRPAAEGPPAEPVPPPERPAPGAVRHRRAVAHLLALLGVVALPGLALWAGGVTGARLGLGMGWIAVAALIWTADLRAPRRWPGWALLAAVAAAIAAAHPVALPGLVLGPVVTGLAARRLTRPLGPDLAERDHEVPVPLRSAGTLLIGRDRAVLTRRRGHLRQALPLAELRLAQPGRLAEPERWPLPGGAVLDLPAGPAVRLVAAGQQWVLPVDEPGLVADVVRRRHTAAWPLRTGPTDAAGWRRLHAWAVRHGTFTWHGRTARALPGWRLWAGAFLALVGSLLLVSAVERPVHASVWVVAVVAPLLGAALAVDWWRVRRRLDSADRHPLPPDAAPWGEQRPDRAPVPSWRPWALRTAR
ncbi:hypothetical protein AB8O55_04115 [Saccharopolyspora cebuensis]|uniref:Uncharacterized protein n=1 Tax=Saccharopolyspora cebuensis TaxID=418759 RepID=A0ABV4CBT9_9PSEU